MKNKDLRRALILPLKEAAKRFCNVGKRFVSCSYLHFSDGTQWSLNDWEPSSRARKETAARSEKTNEQHIWSHRSRHHQPSAAETDEWNHHRRLKIDIFTISQHETTAATVQDKEALCKWIYPTGALEKTEVLLIREGILMGVFNSAPDVDKLCKSHPLYTGQSGVLLWYTQRHKLWQGRRQCLMKTNKGFICKVKGVFMLFKQSHSSEGYVSLRYTDRCITELMLAF